jgi:hypothetical protein
MLFEDIKDKKVQYNKLLKTLNKQGDFLERKDLKMDEEFINEQIEDFRALAKKVSLLLYDIQQTCEVSKEEVLNGFKIN